MIVRIHIAEKTELLREEEQATGVGTDLFFRKKRPGPTVGSGYIVEIYENGIKVDEKEIPLKKQIRETIDEYKEKYNTLRSFQNESQIHVTYKTKEERGEGVEPSTVEKPKEEEKEEAKKNKPLFEEKTETAMQSIDQQLIKKAMYVQELLQRLVDPTIPIKKRANTAVDQGVVDFIPETPLPGEDSSSFGGNETPEVTVANKMITKLVEFVSSKVGAPDDELYNGIKSWMAKVRKSIKKFEKDNNQVLNKQLISQNIKSVVTSGDIAKIKKATGMDISQDVASVLQKVTLMEIGNSETNSASLSESLDKAASIKDDVSKIIGEMNTADGKEVPFVAEKLLKELLGNDEHNHKEIVDLIPDNYAGVSLQKAMEELENENNDSDDITVVKIIADNDPSNLNMSDIRKKEFWSYVKNINKTATIEKVFEEWVNKAKLPLEEAYPIWSKISHEIDSIFNDKKSWYQLDENSLLRLFDSNDLLRECETEMASQLFHFNANFVEKNVRDPLPLTDIKIKELAHKSTIENSRFRETIDDLLQRMTTKSVERDGLSLAPPTIDKAFDFNLSINRVKTFLKSEAFTDFLQMLQTTYYNYAESYTGDGHLANISDELWNRIAEVTLDYIVIAIKTIAIPFIEKYQEKLPDINEQEQAI